MRALDIPSYAAIGILESLWNLCAREAPQGNIGKLSPSDIADAIGWAADPQKLIDSLVESGWLDRSDEHGVIIHDWRDHADDAVDNALARAHLRYADGSLPRMSRLSKSERENLISFYFQSVRTETLTKPLPEPSQSLAKPEPVPVPEPPAKRTSAPSHTAPPSDGSELALANWICEEAGVVADNGVRRVAGEAIRLLAKEGGSAFAAAEYIRAAAIEARACGDVVNRFWFTDQQYRPRMPTKSKREAARERFMQETEEMCK